MNAVPKIHTRKGELIELAAMVVKTRLPLRMVAHHLGIVLSESEERQMNTLIGTTMVHYRDFHIDQIGKGECP